MRVEYSRPVLAVIVFSEEVSIFRNMSKFFFLLLTVFVYKDFKISQYHVVYALCAESSNNKISHCHITKTLK